MKLLALAALALLASAASAQCTCTHTREDAMLSYESMSAVFVGRVVETRAVRNDSTRSTDFYATLEVSEVWKGDAGARVTVEDGPCLVDYHVSEQFLVYATEHSGRHVAGACSRTRRIGTASQETERFRDGGTADDDLARFRAAGIEPHPPR